MNCVLLHSDIKTTPDGNLKNLFQHVNKKETNLKWTVLFHFVLQCKAYYNMLYALFCLFEALPGAMFFASLHLV